MNPVRRGTVDLPAGSDFFVAPLLDAVAMLRAGLASDDLLLLLTGHAGTGKTTVARRLLQELDPQRYIRGGIFGSYGETDALMSLVVHDLGVQLSRPDDAFLTLERFLRRRDNASREAVLLIDEAQSLDAHSLRQLWQLAAPPAGGRPQLHVVLVAQQVPDAVTELTRAGRTPPIGTRCHLRALKAEETREFVLNRIRSKGGTGQPAFSNEALDAIHERSGGVLRRISLLCDRTLMFLTMEGQCQVTAQVVAAVDAQLCGELGGPGLPVRSPVPDGLAAASSSEAGSVSTSDARLHPSATAPPDPHSAERASAPGRTAAPPATSWRTLTAVGQVRLPVWLLAGLLLLFLFSLVSLAMPWFLRATMPTPAPQPAADGLRIQLHNTDMSRTERQQSTFVAPAASAAWVASAASGASAAPASSAVSPTAAAPRSKSAPPPQRATRAATAPPPAKMQAPAPTSVPCNGAADILGLCAGVAPAPRGARAKNPASAPSAPRAEPTSCMPERAALGLCDAS